jgi:hypothetical protein
MLAGIDHRLDRRHDAHGLGHQLGIEAGEDDAAAAGRDQGAPAAAPS